MSYTNRHTPTELVHTHPWHAWHLLNRSLELSNAVRPKLRMSVKVTECACDTWAHGDGDGWYASALRASSHDWWTCAGCPSHSLLLLLPLTHQHSATHTHTHACPHGCGQSARRRGCRDRGHSLPTSISSTRPLPTCLLRESRPTSKSIGIAATALTSLTLPLIHMPRIPTQHRLLFSRECPWTYRCKSIGILLKQAPCLETSTLS